MWRAGAWESFRVLVRSDRRWTFPVSSAELWDGICAVDEYRTWWPWLRGFDARSFEAGERWTCVVQPPLPYTLRFTVSLDDVVAHSHVIAAITGDIVGQARLEVADLATGCEARLVSRLEPGNRVLRAVARVASPMVRFGHDWVLDTGARQFAARFHRS